MTAPEALGLASVAAPRDAERRAVSPASPDPLIAADGTATAARFAGFPSIAVSPPVTTGGGAQIYLLTGRLRL
jgi:hypothetical protein